MRFRVGASGLLCSLGFAIFLEGLLNTHMNFIFNILRNVEFLFLKSFSFLHRFH